jgi:hypothetical protein
MALISRVRLDAYGDSAADIEKTFEWARTMIQTNLARHVSVVEQVIEIDNNEPAASNFHNKGRCILAVDISEPPAPLPDHLEMSAAEAVARGLTSPGSNS